MGTKKKQTSKKRSRASTDRSAAPKSKSDTGISSKLLTVCGAVLVALISLSIRAGRNEWNVLFPAIPYWINRSQEDVTSIESRNQRAVSRVFVQSPAASHAARQDPFSVEKSDQAALAFFLEGSILKAADWNVQTLRLQALRSGATPRQAQTVEDFKLVFLLQNLEAKMVVLSKLLLQGGPSYARQLENECWSEKSLFKATETSRALEQDPQTVPREAVTSLVTQCFLKEGIFRKLADTASTTVKGWNVWHFLASVGNAALTRDALNYLVHDKLSERDPLGRTPTEVALFRGFDRVAAMLTDNDSRSHGRLDKPLWQQNNTGTIALEENLDDGGWGQDKSGSLLDPTSTYAKCDIPVIVLAGNENLSRQDFYTKHLSMETPIIVRRKGSPECTFKRIQQFLSRQVLLQAFGDMRVNVGTVPYDEGSTRVATTVQDYLDAKFSRTPGSTKAPEYLFESLPVNHPTPPKDSVYSSRPLLEWYSSSPTSWAGYDRDVADAALAQDGIGWRSLLEGCPAIGWETCQTKFFSSINSRQTGRRWIRRVLAHLIEFSFSLWQHRNDIRHSKDEDLQSVTTNSAIDAEFELGFQGLHHQFRSRISKPSLKASTLSVRQAWLRRVGLLRKILDDQRERRAPPPWVLRTCGIYTWIRHRRPVSPTPALLALYPELHDMAPL